MALASARFFLKFSPMRHLAAMGLLLALSGCAALTGGGNPPVRATLYDLGAPLRLADGAAPTLPPLALGDVDASAALDTQAVQYRLAYADAQQPRPYAQARWSMPPSQLLRQRLREALSQHRALLNPGEAGVQRTLRIELDDFSQRFDDATRSSGVVRLRATLVDTSGRTEKLLAQRNFALEHPATSADAPGGVRALASATDATIAAIEQWLRAQP